MKFVTRILFTVGMIAIAPAWALFNAAVVAVIVFYRTALDAVRIIGDNWTS